MEYNELISRVQAAGHAPEPTTVARSIAHTRHRRASAIRWAAAAAAVVMLLPLTIEPAAQASNTSLLEQVHHQIAPSPTARTQEDILSYIHRKQIKDQQYEIIQNL